MSETVLCHDDPARLTGRQETTTDIFLRDVNWSFSVKVAHPTPKKRLPVSTERIAALDKLPLPERILAAAHYALELSDVRLKSLPAAIDALNGMEGLQAEGTIPVDRARIVGDFLLAAAVDEKLREAYEIYIDLEHANKEDALKSLTAAWKPENSESLSAIRYMKSSSDPGTSLSRGVSRSAEGILRVAIAREANLEPSALLVKPVH